MIFHMDAFGIRPSLCDMAERLASNGYYVLLPNLYYRSGAVKPFIAESAFKEGPERERLMQLLRSISNKLVMEDIAAFLDFLASQSMVTGITGCAGCCMGGPIRLVRRGNFSRTDGRRCLAARRAAGNRATGQPASAGAENAGEHLRGDCRDRSSFYARGKATA